MISGMVLSSNFIEMIGKPFSFFPLSLPEKDSLRIAMGSWYWMVVFAMSWTVLFKEQISFSELANELEEEEELEDEEKEEDELFCSSDAPGDPLPPCALVT